MVVLSKYIYTVTCSLPQLVTNVYMKATHMVINVNWVKKFSIAGFKSSYIIDFMLKMNLFEGTFHIFQIDLT